MKLRTIKRFILGLTALVSGESAAKIIDFPINDWYQQSLQLAYDKAKDGDTIRFVRSNSNIFHGELTANQNKSIIIEASNSFGWSHSQDIEVSDGTLTIQNFPVLYGNNNESGKSGVNVTSKGSANLFNCHFGNYDSAISISSSGVIDIEECYFLPGDYSGRRSAINLEQLVDGGSLKVSRNTFNGVDSNVVIGREQDAPRYSLLVNNNMFEEVDSPFEFDYDLTSTTGLVANNTVTDYKTAVKNPTRAGKVRVEANNFFNFPEGEFSVLDSLSESVFGNNYSFNPRYEDGEGNLSADSELIDRGVFIEGLAYNGNAPDISRIESPYSRGTTPEPTTITLLGLAGLLARRRR